MIDYSIHPIITALRPLVKNQEVVAFVGAGCSSALNIPKWSDMLVGLNEEFNFYPSRKEVQDAISSFGYAKVATNIKSKAPNEKVYKEKLRRFLTPVTCHFTSLHIELILLSKMIVTTNFDESFEQTFGALGRLDEKLDMNYIKSSLGDFSYKGWGYDRHIFHLHGDITSEDIILTYESYETQYKEPLSGVSRLITDLYSSYSLLFVGFSFNDEFFTGFLKKSFDAIKVDKALFKKTYPKHYCILSDVETKDFLTMNELKSLPVDIDELIVKNVLIEDRSFKSGRSIFRFLPDALPNMGRMSLATVAHNFLLNAYKEIDQCKEKMKLLNDLGITLITFEGGNFLDIEMILRALNEKSSGFASTYKPIL